MSASKKSLSRTGLLLLYSVVLLVCVLKLSGYERGAKPEPVPRDPIYEASMNVDAAIQLATDDGNDTHLLLMLGGNWCGWCYTLHDLLHENAAIKKLMDERKTPLWDSHLRARKAKRLAHPRCKPGERYTVAAYGKAICRACEQADIPSWSPNQLRHSACTRIEREVGIEEARKVAGHAHARTTAIYAETEWQDIVKVMTKLG